jgi:hypothetical protein
MYHGSDGEDSVCALSIATMNTALVLPRLAQSKLTIVFFWPEKGTNDMY